MKGNNTYMKVLVFAPHNDDETIGVGGTIAKLAKEGHHVVVCEVTKGINEKALKMIRDEAHEAHRVLGVAETVFLDLPGLDLHLTPTRQKNAPYLDVVKRVNPEIAFIPHHGDLHSDHASCADSCMVALRPMNVPSLKALYAYETLSESEWNIPDGAHAFIPNSWCDITETLDTKLKAMKCYKSQIRAFPHPRSIEAIEALSRVRGSSVCMESAEAFILLRGIVFM